MDTEHTPEPWRWHAQGEANEYCMLTHDGRWVISFRQNGELTDPKQKANARRIAACVNACIGIPTESLESMYIAGDTPMRRIKALRDEIKEIDNDLSYILIHINIDKDDDGFICKEAMERVLGIMKKNGAL